MTTQLQLINIIIIIIIMIVSVHSLYIKGYLFLSLALPNLAHYTDHILFPQFHYLVFKERLNEIH